MEGGGGRKEGGGRREEESWGRGKRGGRGSFERDKREILPPAHARETSYRSPFPAFAFAAICFALILPLLRSRSSSDRMPSSSDALRCLSFSSVALTFLMRSISRSFVRTFVGWGGGGGVEEGRGDEKGR